MYFVIVKEISSGKIIDKASIALGVFDSNIAQAAAALVQKFKDKYSPENYIITFEESESTDELKRNLETSDIGIFTMYGSKAGLLFKGALSMILGIMLFFMLLYYRIIINPAPFILFILILSAWIYARLKRWMNKGIHKITINQTDLTIFKGAAQVPIQIYKTQIVGIAIRSEFNKRIVYISTGSDLFTSVGDNIHQDKRIIKVSEQTFPKNTFTVFLNKLKILRPELYFNDGK